MDLGAVRQGLADAAAVIPGLNALAYLPDSPPEPCWFPAETEINYKTTFGSDAEVTVTCRLLVSRADDKSGQAKLDAYLSPSGSQSVFAALMAARGAPGQPALNGACDDFFVRSVQAYRWYEHSGVEYVGAEIVIRVIGS